MNRKLFLAFSLFMLGIFAGILFQKQFGAWKVKMILHDLLPLSWKREHTSIDTLAKERLMVALAFGQSNSANFGHGSIRATKKVYNFYQNKLYYAEDPMLGADGIGASTWPRLGDLLINSKLYDNVVFASIGISASSISRWQPDGDLHASLLSTLQLLKQNGLTVTHLLWHQGESDAAIHTSIHDYQQSFKEMLKSIRKQKVTAPMYISLASRYRGHPKNDAIRKAQYELTQQNDSIFLGPDSDQLGDNFRRDGTHFNSAGLDQLAQLWFNQLAISP